MGALGNIQIYYGAMVCLNATVGNADVFWYTTLLTFLVSVRAVAFKISGFKSLLKHAPDAPGPNYKPYVMCLITGLAFCLATLSLQTISASQKYGEGASICMI